MAPDDRHEPSSQVVRERIDAWFMRRLFIPAFEMAPEQLEEFVGGSATHRPVLVDGYAESLNFLAHYATEGGNPGFSPKAIMSSAQMLTETLTRRDRARPSTRGSSTSTGAASSRASRIECGHSRDHHVMDESYLVELLVDGRPAKPGEIGEVVITDLNNFSVPLIRYRIGDLAVAVDESTPCPCGRHLSRVGRIEGRTQAIVHCADGTWLPGTFFAHFFKDYEYAVRFFQIHQSEVGSMTLRLVKNVAVHRRRARGAARRAARVHGERDEDRRRVRRRDPARRHGKARSSRLGGRTRLSARDECASVSAPVPATA